MRGGPITENYVQNRDTDEMQAEAACLTDSERDHKRRLQTQRESMKAIDQTTISNDGY